MSVQLPGDIYLHIVTLLPKTDYMTAIQLSRTARGNTALVSAFMHAHGIAQVSGRISNGDDSKRHGKAIVRVNQYDMLTLYRFGKAVNCRYHHFDNPIDCRELVMSRYEWNEPTYEIWIIKNILYGPNSGVLGVYTVGHLILMCANCTIIYHIQLDGLTQENWFITKDQIDCNGFCSHREVIESEDIFDIELTVICLVTWVYEHWKENGDCFRGELLFVSPVIKSSNSKKLNRSTHVYMPTICLCNCPVIFTYT